MQRFFREGAVAATLTVRRAYAWCAWWIRSKEPKLPHGRCVRRFPHRARHGSATQGARVDQVGVNPPGRAVVLVGAYRVTARRAGPWPVKARWASLSRAGPSDQQKLASVQVSELGPSPGVLTDRFDCRSRWASRGLGSDGEQPRDQRPSAHGVCVNASWKLRDGGEAGAAVAASGTSRPNRPGKARGSIGGRRFGLSTARCWRTARGRVLGVTSGARLWAGSGAT